MIFRTRTQGLDTAGMFRSLPKTQLGFTLLEMLVAMAIGAVLLSVALPSFQSLMGSSQMTATANTLVHSLQTSRSEAIKRARSVGLCTSSNSMTANPSCTNGVGYDAGWIVYVDDNGNGSRDGAEDLVLQVEERSGAFTFTPDAAFSDQVYFNDAGYSTNVADIPLSGRIAIDYGSGIELREVIISANGRISTETP